MPVKKTATKKPVRRRSTTAAKPVRRRRRLSAKPATRLKASAKTVLKGFAGGVAADLLVSLTDQLNITDPKVNALMPVLGAAITDYGFKQPEIAAGMAGAAASNILNAFGLSDSGSGSFVDMDQVKSLPAPENEGFDLQDFGYPLLNDTGIYSSNYSNQF